MLQPISALNTNQYYRKYEKTQPLLVLENPALELSGFTAGRAMLARNNVSFGKISKDTEIKVIYDNSLDSFMETRYPYESTTYKDNYTALFTNLLIIFLTPPYHSDKTDIVLSKDNKHNYHNLVFNPIKEDNIKSVKDGLSKQHELIKALYNTDFEKVLEEIKKYEKELIEEDSNLSSQEKIERVKSIDSITSKDIKQHIEKFLLSKPKIVYCKNEVKND